MQATTNMERGAAGTTTGVEPGSFLTRPGLLLRTEGGVLLALSVLLYWVSGGSWVLFALLILVPDLSALGYLFGAKIGTAAYNSVHNYALPAGLAALGTLAGSPLAVGVALVWFAHIGMDRLVGYGLKYASGFKDTHLDRVWRRGGPVSPRAGLDRAVVVEVAAALADEEGFEELSLARLAERLGVRKPSLYNHVAGLEGIRRELVLLGLRELGRALSDAVEGEEGEAAIFSLAGAYRAFVKGHPGLYGATVRSYRLYAPGDPDLAAAEGAALEPVLSALASCGARGEEAVHAARGLRAIAHGFATLEAAGGFGMPVDVNESFDRVLRAFVRGMPGAKTGGGR